MRMMVLGMRVVFLLRYLINVGMLKIMLDVFEFWMWLLLRSVEMWSVFGFGILLWVIRCGLRGVKVLKNLLWYYCLLLSLIW